MSYTESPMHGSEAGASKIRAKLDAQRGKPILDLADSFIGDEGCALVASYLMENTNVETLDLKGNNIGVEGINQLASVFRPPCNLKTVSLEWNNVGVVDQGVEVLADALAANQTITALDLRNNRIGPEGAGAIANMLKSNSTLERLDLRWNEIQAAGGRNMQTGITANRGLSVVELAGNKIPEDIMASIETALTQKRPPTSGSQNLDMDPRPGSRLPAQSAGVSQQFTSPMRESAGPMKSEDLNNKYNAQILAHSRTEAKIAEYEMLLDQERRKSREIRNDLIKELEQERQMREHTEEQLLRLKEDTMRKEMQDINMIEDLEQKMNSLSHEKNAQLVSIANEKEEIQRRIDYLTDKNSQMEERIAQAVRELTSEEEVLRSNKEKLRLNQTQDKEAVEVEWDRKANYLDDQFKKVKSTRDELTVENKQLEQHLANLRQQNDHSLRTQEETLRDEENRRVAHHDNLQGSKINKVDEGKAILEGRVQNLANQHASMEDRHNKEMAVLEDEIARLKEERGDLGAQIQNLEGNLGHLHGEVDLKEQTITRVGREKDDLHVHVQRKKQSTGNKLAKVSADALGGKEILIQGQLIIKKRNQELNAALREAQQEIAHIKGQHESLIAKLNSNLEDCLEQTMENHMNMLSAKLGLED